MSQILAHLFTNYARIFYSMSTVNNLNVKNINTKKAVNIQYMFYWIKSLTNIEVSSFDASLKTNMLYNFYNINIRALDLHNLNNLLQNI